MRTRFLIAAMLLAALPGAAFAADCKLQIADSIPLIHLGPQRFIPVTINGSQEFFLFDTGGYYTSISRAVADDLKLPVHQGRVQLYDATGNISRDEATVHDFTLGRRHGADFALPVTPLEGFDGILALDQLVKLDTDIDFAANKVNFFFNDHCPGQVVYWTSPASVAVVPMAMEGFHISIPVLLDGHEIRAIIDTGAGPTSLNMNEEKRLFNLTMGSADTPENGVLNGDTTLKVYKHRFQTLKFGDVAVNNPEIDIIPYAMGRNADKSPLVGSRTKSEKDLIDIPDMIIGMDVLDKLHTYIAFEERKMYISSAPPPTPATIAQNAAAVPQGLLQQAYKKSAASTLRALDQKLSSEPENAGLLNERCWYRATLKNNLDGALADCEKAVTLSKSDPHILDSKGFVLFQQGKYQDALAVYDEVLKAAPNDAYSLWMRGNTKGKLGDQPGKDADIAAAKSAQADIELEFKPYNISY